MRVIVIVSAPDLCVTRLPATRLIELLNLAESRRASGGVGKVPCAAPASTGRVIFLGSSGRLATRGTDSRRRRRRRPGMGSGWGGSDDDVRTGTVSAGRERVPVAMPSPKSRSRHRRQSSR